MSEGRQRQSYELGEKKAALLQERDRARGSIFLLVRVLVLIVVDVVVVVVHVLLGRWKTARRRNMTVRCSTPWFVDARS